MPVRILNLKTVTNVKTDTKVKNMSAKYKKVTSVVTNVKFYIVTNEKILAFTDVNM